MDGRDRYEAIRTEWINPPSVRGSSPKRAKSHKSSRSSRAPSPPRYPQQQARHEDITIIREQQAPSPQPPVIIQAPAPPPVMQMAPAPPQVQPMAVAVTQRTDRTHAEIEAEIRQLTNERDQIYYERTGQFVQPVMAPYSGYQVVPYRPRGRESEREYTEIIERERSSSPKREVIRVEKDRKGRMSLVRSKH